jgi:hypothetical protein
MEVDRFLLPSMMIRYVITKRIKTRERTTMIKVLNGIKEVKKNKKYYSSKVSTAMSNGSKRIKRRSEIRSTLQNK